MQNISNLNSQQIQQQQQHHHQYNQDFPSPLSSSLNTSSFIHVDPPFLSLNNDSKPFVPYRQTSKLTQLPREVLTQIMSEYILNECNGSPSAYYSSMHTFLRTIVAVSPEMYDVGIPILYKHVAFSDNLSFDRFLASIEKTGYGALVRTLDFSGYSAVQARKPEKKSICEESLLRLLELCPNLNEFLSTEYIAAELSPKVLKKLFALPYLVAVDFCGSISEAGFVEGMTQVAEDKNMTVYEQVARISLHGCMTLPAETVEGLLKKLPNLTRLDLTDSRINDLSCISTATRLTHLSLAKCQNLTSQQVREFLLDDNRIHPLIWLNLMKIPTIKAVDLDIIVKSLEPLKYLNIHGLPAIPLKSINPTNLQSLFLGPMSIPLAELKTTLPSFSSLLYLDVSGNPNLNPWTIQDPAFLNAAVSAHMIEISPELQAKLATFNIPGFSLAKGQGRRSWLIRGRKVPVTHSQEHALASTVPTPGSTGQQKFTFTGYAKASMTPPLSPVLKCPPCSNMTVPKATSNATSVLGMDMGSPVWRHGSRKLNVCYVGIGGNRTEDACKERGIYLYYGYRR